MNWPYLHHAAKFVLELVACLLADSIPLLVKAWPGQCCTTLDSLLHFYWGWSRFDCKPSNVLLDCSGAIAIAKITDFGLSKIFTTTSTVGHLVGCHAFPAVRVSASMLEGTI